MTIEFLTFGGGNQNYLDAATRLGRQAKESGKFDRITVENPYSLKSFHPTFFESNNIFMQQNLRGYGLWIWKPYLVSAHLRKLNPGDLLCYFDSGCHLNFSTTGAHKNWLRYTQIAQDRGVFAMHLRSNQFKRESIMESSWTTTALSDRLELNENDLMTPQIQATFFIIQKNANTIKLAESWYEIAREGNYKYLFGPHPNEGKPSNFIEHREDQSIFSGLLKKMNIETIEDESWFNPNWTKDGKKYPIWALRNRTGGDPFEGSLYNKLRWELRARFRI
jgi:hypothetical protein